MHLQTGFLISNDIYHDLFTDLTFDFQFIFILIEKGIIERNVNMEQTLILDNQNLVICHNSFQKQISPSPDIRGYALFINHSYIRYCLMPYFPQSIIKQIFKLFDKPVLTIGLDQNQIQNLITLSYQMEAEHRSRLIYHETQIRVLFVQFLISLSRYLNSHSHDQPDRGRKERLEELKTHIQVNYAEDFSLQELANRLHTNQSYLSRWFREYTGIPLFEYINQIRIQKACLLLKRTDKSVIEIAFDVGYKSLSFFNRYFRKIMNTSPSNYRNLSRR